MSALPLTFNPGTVVWKYPLNLDPSGEAVLEFARGSILRVDMQDGQVVAWVAVINQHATLRRRVVIRGTGDPLPDGGQLAYLNTFFSGPFVFHAFAGTLDGTSR